MLKRLKKKYFIANWKMNFSITALNDYKKNFDIINSKYHFIISPPSCYLSKFDFDYIKLSAQNMSEHKSGAYTGELSACMLKDVGCEYVILGHSERRSLFKETDNDICKKTQTALESGLTPIVCIGEELNERDTFQDVIKKQLELINKISANLKNLETPIIIAYEPVWAIGTGKTPSIQEIKDAIFFIKSICDFDIVYGGSVNYKNILEILSIDCLDGVLVGNQSLKPHELLCLLD